MPDVLALEHVTAGYDRTVIVEDVTLSLAPGNALAVLGRNGVGKTTLMRTIAGHTTLHHGRIRLEEDELTAMPAWKRARRGLGVVPQEREVFPSLTVLENIMVAFRLKSEAAHTLAPWTLERIFELFPSLAARRGNFGNQLSGGEQQMLSIARALALQPRLLLLDEPFEGLAPAVVDRLVAVFKELRRAGLSIVLAEQHARLALAMTDEAVALVRGRIVVRGASRALVEDPAPLEEALTIQDQSKGASYA